MTKRLLKYSEKHDKIMKASGKTLVEVQSMDDDGQNQFISDVLLDYMVFEPELADAADDIIDMIKEWEVGQTEGEVEEYDLDEPYEPAGGDVI